MARRSRVTVWSRWSAIRCLLFLAVAAPLLLGATAPAQAASKRPWSVYSATVNGVKHTLGATRNAPPKVQARVRRQVASDPVTQAMLSKAAAGRGGATASDVKYYTCYGDCSYTITAFPFLGGCGDVVLTILSFFNGGMQQLHTWSHWCALGGFTIGNTPNLAVSQDSQSAWPAGTGNNQNPYFYSWYSGHPRSGYHVGGIGHWITCQALCSLWSSRIEHYMHSDGTEYFHMFPAR
jgi:hypothetical protein